MLSRQIIVVCSCRKIGKGQPGKAGRKLKNVESGSFINCVREEGSVLSNAADRFNKMKTKD